MEMNAFTGDFTAYPFEPDEGNSISFTFKLPPAGSLLLFVSDSKVKGIQEIQKPGEPFPVQASSHLSVKRQADNVLMIDFCDLILEGQVSKDLNVLDASDQVYEYYGFEGGNPWSGHVQFNNDLVARDTFGAESNVNVIYRFQLDGGFDFSGMKAVVEKPEVWAVSLNGTEVKAIPGEWWLDRNFGVFDIGHLVMAGENELSLHISPMDLMAEIQPVYITGDFSVVPAIKGWKMNEAPANYAAGSWSEQGMPFYAGGITYSKSFQIQDPAGFYELELGSWKGTVSEITVNGTSAGIIAFPPFTLDLTGFIEEGINTLEVTVVGSLKNLLGPHHNNPPAGMAISPFWRGVPPYPPGEEYQILDYGLLDDIYLSGR
jgi:hypothetical protein